jgi:hypothetical protein
MRLALAASSFVAVLVLAGCGSSPPPIADGAWSVELASCNMILGGNTSFGAITQSAHATVETQGVANAMISCSVAPGSSGFAVNVTAVQGADSLEIGIPSIPASATLASPATGQVSFAGAQTADNQYASDACNFYFVPSTPETVTSAATGSIFVAFNCPSLMDSSEGGTCDLSQGYAFFENCETTAAE